jgi:hypothetical protein
MTEDLLVGLGRVAESLEFHSADSFSVFGRKHNGAPQVTKPDPDSMLTGPAIEGFATLLYQVLHCRIGDQPFNPVETIQQRWAFATNLSAVNSGTGPWHSDWRLDGIHQDGRMIVSQDGLRIWASREEFRTADDRFVVGEVGELRMPAEYRCMSPGYYTALGDADAGRFPHTVRLYWHLVPAGAERFVRLLTAGLNGAGIPFQLKILDDPSHYHRADAAVLYLPRERLPDATPLLARIYRDTQSFCLDSVSHFCLRLAPGVALAEDPGEPGTSFGLHRSRLLATSFAARAVASRSAADRVAMVTDRLTALGLGLERFHLNAGSPEIAFQLT